MESNNISYVILGIIIGSFVDLNLILALVVIFAIVTNEPDYQGIRPRTLMASILYGIYLFILNSFYPSSNKIKIATNKINCIEEINESQQLIVSKNISQSDSQALLISQNPQASHQPRLSPNNAQLSKNPILQDLSAEKINSLKPIILNFNSFSISPKIDKKMNKNIFS